MRTALLVLAIVPIVTLVALWAWSSTQLYVDWRQQRDRNEVSTQAAQTMAAGFLNLQEERRLSGPALSDPAEYGKELRTQRARTDSAVKAVIALPDSGWNAPSDIRREVTALGKDLEKLDEYRAGVDERTASQTKTFDRYTDLISHHLKVFDTLSNVGLAGVDRYAMVTIDQNWGVEMVSREDAMVTRIAATGVVSGQDRIRLAALIGSQESIYENKVIPLLPKDEAKQFEAIMNGAAWKTKAKLERSLLTGPATGTDTDPVPDSLGRDWRKAVGQVNSELQKGNSTSGQNLTDETRDELASMRAQLIISSLSIALAVALVALITVLVIRMLRRRINALRTAALDLQTRLPDVVQRMREGETVDVDAELPQIRHAEDELGQLGQALNLARHTALETTVTQVGQFRGFERMLQRIARRTQLLIGLQMKKLSELERRHEDPEVLEGLFDLDHLTARLRRYEENLVILGGGQPQRRWRKPVLLLDVLRSAQSEVQDYRRIQIDVENRVWLSERAVGQVIHVLAELMENAVGFSKPPAPVEVYAARVGRGLAVEIEDRGVGMDPEQYEAINRMMAEPPRMDVMSRADDVRLGLYVVARLADGLGIQVELRPSAFGGTRVVVLIPDDLVVVDGSVRSTGTAEENVTSWRPSPDPGRETEAEPAMAHEPVPALRHSAFGVGGREDEGFGGVPHPRDGRHPDAPYGNDGHHHPAAPQDTMGLRLGRPGAGPVGVAPHGAGPGTVRPLPKRVRQASLNEELRAPVAAGPGPQPDDERGAAPPPSPTRSGAAIGAFQRQSRMARQTPRTADHDDGAGGVLPPARKIPTEDRP